jgi:hypothetical protein
MRGPEGDNYSKWRQSAKFVEGLQHSYYSYFCERSAASSAFGDLGDRISRQAVEPTPQSGLVQRTSRLPNTIPPLQARLRLGQTVAVCWRGGLTPISTPSQGGRESGVEGPHRPICCFDAGHLERAISARLFRGPQRAVCSQAFSWSHR